MAEELDFSDRYRCSSLIGEGGVARVYLADDLASARQVALKVLVARPNTREHSAAKTLFEREFHTLTQLRHPHIVSVYDYGITADARPYYTMELLDGGDLRERAPVPWREACRLFFDAASALALLHSRRLLHRDISPRNIRQTLGGEAKLIDFGATVPMNAGGTDLVGTPAFTAPESLHRLALDARTDLYSLGATLYFALTGRLPYAARTFAELPVAWSCAVLPPSAVVHDIPAALDDLVLAMIHPDAMLRPSAAFDVMQRLAACAGLPAHESEAVSLAYLATPTLVGRAEQVTRVRQLLSRPASRRATGLMIEGVPGAGRSRLLDAAALEATALGFTVLRVNASGSRTAHGIAQALAMQLLQAHPSSADPTSSELFVQHTPKSGDTTITVLTNITDEKSDRSAVQQALCQWLARVATTRPLFIAVDDAQRMDSVSAAVLAALLDQQSTGRMVVAITADSEESHHPVVKALARRCERLTLSPLTRDETEQLLTSVFGDAAHLPTLNDELQRLAHGNPGQSMEILQWLVDRRVVRYAAGSWTLPSQLSAGDLPDSAAVALQGRIDALSEHAQFLAEAHALAYYEELGAPDYYVLLPQCTPRVVDEAIDELVWAGAVAITGESYTLANRVWTAAFVERLSSAQAEARHRALIRVYEATSTMAAIHHAFAGGLQEHGLQLMLQQHKQLQGEYNHKELLERNVGKMMWCAAPAIETALRTGCSPREIHELRRWHLAGLITTEDGAHDASAQIWYAQLVHDSGLDLYWADKETRDPGQRLLKALTQAQQRYLDTPAHQRVYPVEEAIRLVAEYVVCTIALGARSQDTALLRRLPTMLEPFVSLSPVLEALWNNANATVLSQCDCRYDTAHERWRDVLAKLEPMSPDQFKHVVALRTAVMFALGIMEAHVGLPTASQWAEQLDADPYQRISALQLRQIVYLERGDPRRAQAMRRQAEVLALQTRSPQMFRSLLLLEMSACARSRDMAGMRQVIEELRPLAERHAGWAPCLTIAEAYFDLLRGDYEASKLKFAACSDKCAPDEAGESLNLSMWLAAQQGLVEVLLHFGRAEEARACARAALEQCQRRGIESASYDLISGLALAEAKLGDARGAQRLEAVIAEQQRRGVSGLRVGVLLEARAQVAIWMNDRAAFQRFAELTAREYRYGAGNPLAARYARLMNEAARHGWHTSAGLAALENFKTGGDTSASMDGLTHLSRALSRTHSTSERTRFVLEWLCGEQGCEVGHLYFVSELGLTLADSRGAGPDTQLQTELDAWLANERARAEELDDMATGGLSQEQAECARVHGGHGSYELQPLHCIVDGRAKLVAVAALRGGDVAALSSKRAELQMLAQQLLRAGDSTGL